ncbi:MAG TPA: M23 family metallopeptidase, partial [Acidimicrobiales bacterium]|nr:M23 family metallopeptidase [Acidimicrobiales bacterium]
LSYTVGRFDLHRKVPVVAAPLKGGGWIAANGCCNSEIIHPGSSQTVNGQLFFAQRFAIDWLRLDDEGRVVDGDPLLVESWTAYGADLFAAADGTVVGVLDGLPDQIPGQLPDPSTLNIENIDGNHVVLDLGDGFFVFYAHMKPGSVAVELGDRVENGDFLGHLGELRQHVGPAPALPRRGQRVGDRLGRAPVCVRSVRLRGSGRHRPVERGHDTRGPMGPGSDPARASPGPVPAQSEHHRLPGLLKAS